MVARNHVVLLVEHGQWESVHQRFALDLAKRLDCALAVLVLAEAGPDAQSAKPDDLVASLLDAAAEDGVEIHAEVRQGDQASELLKFLAARPSVRALIWGGDDAALTSVPGRKSKHWFARLRHQIACPIVTSGNRTTAVGAARAKG